MVKKKIRCSYFPDCKKKFRNIQELKKHINIFHKNYHQFNFEKIEEEQVNNNLFEKNFNKIIN